MSVASSLPAERQRQVVVMIRLQLARTTTPEKLVRSDVLIGLPRSGRQDRLILRLKKLAGGPIGFSCRRAGRKLLLN
jgi:hypothetical protein